MQTNQSAVTRTKTTKAKPEFKAALMSMKDICTETGKSRVWVYSQIKNNPTFPKPVKLGEYNIAFRRSEFDTWLDSLEYVEPCGLSVIDRRVLNAAGKAGGV